MTLADYQRIKQQRIDSQPVTRLRCWRCRRAMVTCFCGQIVPFHSDPRFVILIHREETRRAVASGRMASLCLENSVLIEGVDFSENETVNEILRDPLVFPVVLFPGPTHRNLGEIKVTDNRRLVIFLFDGTWSEARRMRRLSENLKALPTFSLSPQEVSRFSVRRQPRPHCLATIEAIYEVLEVFNSSSLKRPHDNLLDVFKFMVATQAFWEDTNGRVAVRGIRK